MLLLACKGECCLLLFYIKLNFLRYKKTLDQPKCTVSDLYLKIWLIDTVIYLTKINEMQPFDCRSSVLEWSSRVELRVKVNRLEHQAGEIICASGHSTMRKWSHSFPVWWLAVNPGEAMLACIYADPLIGNFSLLADASRAAKLVNIVYYFLLCIRAVACSLINLIKRKDQ